MQAKRINSSNLIPEDPQDENTISTEKIREKLLIKARASNKRSKWSRARGRRSKTPTSPLIQSPFRHSSRVQTFEPEHVAKSAGLAKKLRSAGGKAWDSTVLDKKQIAQAGSEDSKDSSVGSGEEEIKMAVSDLSNDSMVEVEDALQILRRHAKRLGVRESDLLQAVKSEDDTFKSHDEDDDEPLTLGEEVWEAVANYFKPQQKKLGRK